MYINVIAKADEAFSDAEYLSELIYDGIRLTFPNGMESSNIIHAIIMK
ncbi:hypothetical protein [Terribacillus sp. AE2B 122]|nr:hypothetical protein [Terribacillus sp. AE2B 122]